MAENNLHVLTDFGEKLSLRVDFKYVSKVYTDFENIEKAKFAAVMYARPAQTDTI